MALHDIEHLRGPQRESVRVFTEFYKAMQASKPPPSEPWWCGSVHCSRVGFNADWCCGGNKAIWSR
jgi:hypothetical protein